MFVFYSLLTRILFWILRKAGLEFLFCQGKQVFYKCSRTLRISSIVSRYKNIFNVSSPVITPLVRGLMTKYKATGANVTSATMYDDVIKALGRLVVKKLTEACRNGDCGATDETGKVKKKSCIAN